MSKPLTEDERARLRKDLYGSDALALVRRLLDECSEYAAAKTRAVKEIERLKHSDSAKDLTAEEVLLRRCLINFQDCTDPDHSVIGGLLAWIYK